MTRGKGRLLVVDDEPSICDALRAALSTEGYAVQAVENAIQAIAELEKQEVEVVLADLSLPRVSGLELLDRIKKS
ncbi:MAG TPA: response regulator, partial [Candidatus Binatia bacterium]|nr:response regulator [Candidatus Binatia bacterium]